MERLTDRFDDGKVGTIRYPDKTDLIDMYDCIEDEIIYASVQKTIIKLAEYEDTGLNPEEISSIKEQLKTQDEIVDNLNEDLKCYRDAEEQGLLIKLPCKIGNTVYWLSPFKSGINQGKIEFINLSKFGLDLGIMGRGGTLSRREFEKVFLTREAAEEALRGSASGMKIIQCPHCDKPNEITRKETNSIERDGKLVKNCEGCNKLFVIEVDDGVYFAH